ncbi:MAG: hypothetical protein AMJ54_10570 [Deltaproteobacteria bacterium SG8_13]|nr:MAG: hypothetical protein AMJ54_10570 [Deltaproteobacteria bacterium SG8_13]
MARNKGDRRDSHDFFEESAIAPMAAATGPDQPPHRQKGDPPATGPKQKAGFYLSKRVLARFNRKFYELKMEGKAIGNKSALLEAALDFALDDIDRGSGSKILAVFTGPPKM